MFTPDMELLKNVSYVAMQNTALIRPATEINSLNQARKQQESDRGRRPKKMTHVKAG